MLIKEIKKLKNNKYKITYDDKILLVHEDILIKYNILTKKNIDDKLLIEIEKENIYLEAYDKALRYLGIKMRLEKDIYTYLKDKYDNKTINKVIDKLKKEGYLDTNKYIKAFINDKINLTNDGPYKIKRDLINKGIDESLIDLDIIDINIIKDNLTKLIIKYSNINRDNSISVIKSKTLNHCLLLGYDKELILDIFDSLNIKENTNKIKKDYDKLINKYKTKYTGYKLEATIKQKLYQKGYSMDEINNINK